MRLGGRIAAAIEILDAIETQHRPVKLAVKEWGAAHRFAGSGDRAFISGLVMDALRRKASLGFAMGDDSPRALAMGVVGRIWKMTPADLAQAFADDPHAPEPLTDAEIEGFTRDIHDAPAHVRGDYPEWLDESLLRVFGEFAAEEGAAMSDRAPVDLRVNELKSDPDKALSAVTAKIPTAHAGHLARSCIRIPQTDPTGKSAPADSIPAYGKGWVEVQDEGSQLAGLAAGVKPGDQVLDLCAGAGGKTLELAAMTGNTGQIHAWDIDWRRLRAIWPRLQRAGCRNVQVHDGPEDELAELEGKMDVVFVDAPCTGTGTWRRRPDAKWRVSEKALNQRIQEQDQVLDTAAKYVKAGGRLIYVTCSILPEENNDRVEAFLTRDRDFSQLDTLAELTRSGGLVEGAEATLSGCNVPGGALQLSPRRSATDGFFIAVMKRAT
ncbi:RsmB/NOP family class I SAM-dependent RNA methyltransferase [Hyphobacterium sp. HN65]|uniref:RsmB/NOP family class I SAM-dependent RNA methyltransferase n=1 Tax=Hyphobacterium lacteum TaxID=3116575 RepID=A0ABU7LLF6_9PROT|nr:RsmB/NOP family class I SAM-dependent RNA methyltransferase [Hyphobacterium sp. HN65]MEE2524732.1 RsmB/NOP family class I SAM-dependent RNA methyltransferase [Hyphobacterium sp. HN65]